MDSATASSLGMGPASRRRALLALSSPLLILLALLALLPFRKLPM